MNLPKELRSSQADNSLARLTRLWPSLDSISQDSLMDYFERLRHSWVTYSESLTEAQKHELMVNVAAELERRANGLEKMYEGAGSCESPSPPSAT